LKKITLVCLISVMALAAMGIGFAMWADSVTLSASAETGSLKFGYEPGTDEQDDDGADRTCGPWLVIDPDNKFCPENKDVGSTETSMSDLDGDGVYDLINVTVNEAYPCYYNDVSWWVHNYGTIPVIIQKAKLIWGVDENGQPKEHDIESGTVYLLCEGGTILPIDETNLPADPDQYYREHQAVFEFRWGDNTGLQLHPGKGVEQSLKFHVVQPAEQNYTYNFGLIVQGVQWNESPIEGHLQQ